MKSPSDLKILSTIYKMYYKEFKNYACESDVQSRRKSKIFVPIHCKTVAKKLNVDHDIVFGRLYYHLQQKYGYTREDGSKVAFYTTIAGEENRCVNFPLLASVLAGLQEESSKFKWATALSGLAVMISILVPLVTALLDKP
ncbi:hypothetical protein [Pseudomonas sp. ADAK13]|uniref:hypothetical protein n=1 Tax=Pseudomonas sp. ADAK13 TaxID=2730847 RepID=UPI001462DF28|nr:hypothetical protein [Pseudomonas sp. ADAK13]QJI38614.1 hypothetical protein HKK54_30870 [Pseudomonas sp. ADAK13]